jgi:hypothetical protein
VNEEQPYRYEKGLAECTFTPKTNNCKPPYRSFKEFTDSQEEFLWKREAKIKRIKE